MKYTILLVLWAIPIIGFAQNTPEKLFLKNNLYLAIADFSLLGVNYEHILKEKPKSQFGIKAGLAISIIPYPSDIIKLETLFGLGLNLGAFYLFPHRNKKNHWEIGLHNTIMFRNERGGFVRETVINGVRTVEDSTYIVKTTANMTGFRIGFRHQKPQGGFFYKIGLTPATLNLIHENRPKPALFKQKSLINATPFPEFGFGWTF